jgi:hypothetical protein
MAWMIRQMLCDFSKHFSVNDLATRGIITNFKIKKSYLLLAA